MQTIRASSAKYAAACALAVISAGALAGEITLYEQSGLRGASMTTDDAVPNVERTTSFPVSASSAVVSAGTWEVCTLPNFRGRCAQLPPGTYSRLRGELNGPIASVREIGYTYQTERVIITPDTSVGVVEPDRYYYRNEPAVVVGPPADGAIVYGAPVPVPAGPLVILYQHTSSGIRAVQLSSSIDDLDTRQFAGVADSALVSSGVWRLCDGTRGSGTCADYQPGQYASLQSFNGKVKSAYLITSTPNRVATAVATPGRAVLYEYPNFGGPSAVVQFGRAPDLDWARFTNPASSMRIESGSWLVCSQLGYQGECRILEPGDYPSLAGMFSNGNGVLSARQVWSPTYGSVDFYRVR